MATVVYLVHGTYAQNAQWTLVDSRFSECLRKSLGQDIDIKVFSWDGLNSIDSRLLASEHLCKQLEALVDSRRCNQLYVVGHSHGGNIALQAISRMNNGEAVTGLVTLGTPFVRVKRKGWAPPFLLSIGFAIWPSLILATIVSIGAQIGSLAGIAITLLVFPIFAMRIYSALKRADARSRTFRSLPAGRGGAAVLPVLCVRHGGDEASFWLLVLSIPRVAERFFSSMGASIVGDNYWRTIAKSVLLSFGIAALFAFQISIPVLALLLMFLIFLIITLPLLSLIGTIITSHKFGFGGRTTLESFFIDMLLEPTPSVGEPLDVKFSGALGFIRSSSFWPFRLATPHSLGYTDPKAIDRACKWMGMLSTQLPKSTEQKCVDA